MELDDLRRRWQQPTPAETPIETTEKKLTAMLAAQNSPVSEMERHLKKNQRMLLVVLFLNMFNIGNMLRRHGQTLVPGTQMVLWVLLAAIILFMGWHLHRFKRAMNQLRRTDEPTYGHIQGAIRQMRVLMKNRLRVVLAFLGLVTLTVLYGRHETILRSYHAGRIDWGITTLMVLGATALLLFLIHFGQEKQQRQYGQHLDRLESALRELE